jgi:hypothetical protein
MLLEIMMKTMAFLVFGGACIALYISCVRQSKLQIDGCYNSDMLGHIGKHDYLCFRGTNVWMGSENGPEELAGSLILTNGAAIWRTPLKGATIIIYPTNGGLVCVDPADHSSKQIVKRLTLAPQKARAVRVLEDAQQMIGKWF